MNPEPNRGHPIGPRRLTCDINRLIYVTTGVSPVIANREPARALPPPRELARALHLARLHLLRLRVSSFDAQRAWSACRGSHRLHPPNTDFKSVPWPPPTS